MKFNKKTMVPIVAIFAIALIAFAIVYIVIPVPHTGAFWVAYIFALLSIVIGGALTCWAFGKNDSLESKFYSFPIFKLGYMYAILQNIASIIIFIISVWVKVPTWCSVVVSILLLAFAGIGSIAREGAKEVIENVVEKTKIQTKQVEFFNIDIGEILALCSDEDIKAKLKVLAEKIRYCDPVSIEQTKSKEAEISYEIEELRKYVSENNKELSMKAIDKISGLIDTRSRISQMNK